MERRIRRSKECGGARPGGGGGIRGERRGSHGQLVKAEMRKDWSEKSCVREKGVLMEIA